MKKVLVLGAKGMLASDLCPILEGSGFDVVRADIEEFDISDFEQTKLFFLKNKPDIVVHCAAYTNVDASEKFKDKAKLINAVGSENVAKCAAMVDAELVYISTDYVFDGKKTSPYEPCDIPNPVNTYGKTKLDGECAVKDATNKFYIIRTSWLYGKHGANFVETMLNLAKPDPHTGRTREIKVVDDQTGCPTYSVDLSGAIVKILKENYPYGTYNAAGAGSVTWYGFAKEIFKHARLNPNLIPCATKDFPRDAKRPAYSVLKSSGLCLDWRDGLGRYFLERGEK